MNALTDLKRLFEKHDIKVTYFDGYKLKTKKIGNWGLALGEYRQNGQVKTVKEINEIITRNYLASK